MAIATFGDNLGINRRYSPNFGDMASQFSSNRAEKEAASMAAQAKALGDLAQANATVKAYEAQADAAKSSAQSGMFGKIAGAGLGLLGKVVTGGLA